MDDRILRPFAANSRGQAVCAVIGKDEVPWPTQSPDLLVHLSPPCTALSKARAGSASGADVEGGLELLRFSLDLVLEKGYSNWSLENVSTVTTRGLLDAYVARHPDKIAHATFDAADYGTPQTRVRLIASTPATVKLMKQEPVHRVSVADAFAAAGLRLPAAHLKSNTCSRDGTPCVRSVQGQSFTVTASHPLTWCQPDGATIRCLTPSECALLQGFPSDWRLPAGSRLGIRAAGNAIPPPMAAAIVRCALRAAGLMDAPPLPLPPEASAPRYVSHARYRALKRRVDLLEACLGEGLERQAPHTQQLCHSGPNDDRLLQGAATEDHL
jgi:site-specific DNA-cytosine methylase